MRLFLKKLFVVTLAISAVLIIAGCTETGDGRQVADDEPLISEIKNEQPIPLADIVAKNDRALELTTDIGVNASDEFLVYVDRQKQRDRRDREPKISASLDGLGAAMADALAEMAEGLAGALSGLLGQVPSVTPTPTPTPTAPTPPEAPPAVEEPPNQYAGDNDGFSITFPGGWRITEQVNGDKNIVKAEDTTENDAYLENIVVEVEELPFESNLGEYADQVISEHETSLVGFTEIERGEATIDGTKAKKIIYSHRRDGRTLKVLMYVFPVDLKGHVIAGSAVKSKYSEYETAFEKSAASFKFQAQALQ